MFEGAKKWAKVHQCNDTSFRGMVGQDLYTQVQDFQKNRSI